MDLGKRKVAEDWPIPLDEVDQLGHDLLTLQEVQAVALVESTSHSLVVNVSSHHHLVDLLHSCLLMTSKM